MQNYMTEREDVNTLVKKLEKYDIISFDIFDTLILRPFLDPADLFRILGRKHNIINFYELRKKAQKTAREKAKKMYGTTEVTIYDIYKELNLITDLDIETGVKEEFEAEKNFCYANPYMKKVFDELIARGKNVIIVSDMYIPHDMMKELLESCGYTGEKELFVSCDYKMTKVNGDLFKYLKENYIFDQSIIHIGDNEKSDIQRANENDIKSYHYKKNSDFDNEFLNIDMSQTIGSLYKGILSNFLYNGTNKEKLAKTFYRYGFTYSGIFVLGYVSWIHKYAQENNLDKLLFLARDGYILKKVYDMLYDDIPSEYCLWSRNAALRTAPEKDINRYIWQFISRVVEKGQTITVKELLDKLNLNFLQKELSVRSVNLNNELSKRYADILRELIIENRDLIKEENKSIIEATKIYYSKKIDNCKNIGIVDIGYRGSGAAALKELFEDWGFNCNVKSLLAIGTARKTSCDDVINLSEDMNVYAISNYKNYDFSIIFQKYLLTNIAIIDILVASAPKPSFLYFDIGSNGEIIENFDEEDSENYEMINELDDGIIDFIREYVTATNNYKYLQNIPSRDAVSPLLSLMNEESYKKLSDDFKDFYYTYLLTDKKTRKIKSFYDIYQEEAQKYNQKTIVQKTKKKKSKKKKLDKILRKIRKNVNSSETRIRYYYTKCYEKEKVHDNTMIFQSYAGDNFSGNPYYILKELYGTQKDNFTFYVGAKPENVKKITKFLKAKKLDKVNVVRINSRKYAKILATAKYLINNVGFPNYFIKKTGQIYINTWHGTPLKGLGKSIKDAPNESGNYQRNFLMTDYFIMPNYYTYEIMKKDYMINNLYKGKYIISGYPRNSIFYNESERKRVIEELGLQNKKVLVYMPTWRRAVNGKHEKQIEVIESLLDKINNNLGNNEILFVKLHNLVTDGIDISKYDKIRMFPNNYETYEFLNIADILITDYSSVMFDYANLEKKIILYAYDEEEYMNGRSVYTSIADMPFKIARTEQDVIREIKSVNDIDSYTEFKNKYCTGDSKDLCKKICDYIFLGKISDLNIENEQNINNNNILVYVGNLAETYKREMIFKELSYVQNKENIYINFYRKRTSKNKLFINEFSDDFNYINMQGEKDLTISEAIANILYNKLKLKGKWVEKKVNSIYAREVKRLFPTIKFSKVIDMIGNSAEILKLYSHINADEREVYIINNNIYKINKWKKYKRELIRLKNKFTNIYLEEGIKEENNTCKLTVIKQDTESLFQNKNNIEEREISDIFDTDKKERIAIHK